MVTRRTLPLLLAAATGAADPVTFTRIPSMQRTAHGYAGFGIPSLLSTRGQLFAFVEGRKFSCADAPGQHDLLCQRSDDGGAAWTNCSDGLALVDVGREWGPRCAGKATTCAVWDPTPVAERSSGKIFVFFSLSPPGMTAFARSLMLIESATLGRTWTPPRNLSAELTTLPPGYQGTFTGNPGLQLASGRLVVPMYHVTPENKSVWPDVMEWQGTLVSDTRGASWRVGALQYAEGTAEGAIAQLGDGPDHLLAAMRIDELLHPCESPPTLYSPAGESTHSAQLRAADR